MNLYKVEYGYLYSSHYTYTTLIASKNVLASDFEECVFKAKGIKDFNSQEYKEFKIVQIILLNSIDVR